MHGRSFPQAGPSAAPKYAILAIPRSLVRVSPGPKAFAARQSNGGVAVPPIDPTRVHRRPGPAERGDLADGRGGLAQLAIVVLGPDSNGVQADWAPPAGVTRNRVF